GTICQNQAVTLHATLPGVAADRKLKYEWTVNGQPTGSDSPDLPFTPTGAGPFNVQLTVTDVTPLPPPLEKPKKFPVRCWVQPPAPTAPAPVTATATLTPNTAPPTISSAAADPNTISCAAVAGGQHTANLTAQATAGACGGNLTYKWTVTEGTLTNDTSQTAAFDSSSVSFEGGAQAQTKTVTATVTVTDQNGQTATQTTTITVNCPAQWVRLDDVVFAKNNARVNNCGKRLLIDDAPRVASGDYDIVLVGHRDTDERAALPGKASKRAPEAGMDLDEARALNAAAVLSGGGGTCANVDPSRIKLDWVGTDQTSETRPGLCGTSNIKERRGQSTTEADKNRRVEIYLVPHNSTSQPPAVKEIKPTPDVLKALGCPK
ncbi:MAG: PKD domain-containing protein, partial [Acidobacteriaceae bacterium]|nr:PKD domain-containing protein [Acidobacteriaceae bacterium]